MEKFVLFELHEYMDMYPKKHVMTFKGNDEEDIASNASMWAKEMTRNYSGGPTRFIKVMSKEEAKAHVESLVKYEDEHPQDDSETFKQEMWNLYYKCY